jgi:prophage antirepressor-like protein
MNDLVNFTYEDRQIRTVVKNGEPWWVAKDVAEALGYSSTNMVQIFSHVPDEWKGSNQIATLGGPQNMLCLSEPGLYFFLGRSDKPAALPFQKWIAGEVLPSIRKTGSYALPGRALPPAATIRELRLALKEGAISVDQFQRAIGITPQEEKPRETKPTPREELRLEPVEELSPEVNRRLDEALINSMKNIDIRLPKTVASRTAFINSIKKAGAAVAIRCRGIHNEDELRIVEYQLSRLSWAYDDIPGKRKSSLEIRDEAKKEKEEQIRQEINRERKRLGMPLLPDHPSVRPDVPAPGAFTEGFERFIKVKKEREGQSPQDGQIIMGSF